MGATNTTHDEEDDLAFLDRETETGEPNIEELQHGIEPEDEDEEEPEPGLNTELSAADIELDRYARDAKGKPLAEAALQRFLKAARNVRASIAKHRERAWHIGHQLSTVKKLIGRPQFLAYLEQYADVHEVTAGRYIAIYEAWPKLSQFNAQVQQTGLTGEATFRKLYDAAKKATGRDMKPRRGRRSVLKVVQKFVEAVAKAPAPSRADTEALVSELKTARAKIDALLAQLTPKAKAA